MTIDKEKIAKFAKEAQLKKLVVDTLNARLNKEKSPEVAAELSIAVVEYRRAKRALDMFMEEQSIVLIKDLSPRESNKEQFKWQPWETAPKDGSPIIAILTDNSGVVGLFFGERIDDGMAGFVNFDGIFDEDCEYNGWIPCPGLPLINKSMAGIFICAE